MFQVSGLRSQVSDLANNLNPAIVILLRMKQIKKVCPEYDFELSLVDL